MSSTTAKKRPPQSKKSAVSSSRVPDSGAPIYDGLVGSLGCDPVAVGERPAWDYAEAYERLFKVTPEQYQAELSGSPKRRRRVGG